MRKLTAWGPDAGQPLGVWLAARLPCSVEEATSLVARGAVYVDGRRVRDPGTTLRAGAKIAVHAKAAPAAGDAPLSRWKVVYEDPDVLVIDKPPGLATQAVREAAGALDEQVAAKYPGAKGMHRLDRDASGLVLFARTPDARRRLQAAFAAGGGRKGVAREYVAIVAGHPPDTLRTIDAPIGPEPGTRRMRAGQGGDPARTQLTVTRRGIVGAVPAAELAVSLDTGRTHQIRVHLAHAGFPILGDRLYAPPEVAALTGRLALHATRLRWSGGTAVSPLPASLSALVR